MKNLVVLATTLAMLASVACAGGPSRMYLWSGYQWSAYSGNQINRGGPDSPKFETTLKQLIAKSDASGRKPAPGILAEYGYLLLKRGDAAAAIPYFEREAREWAESEAFMRQVITQAREVAGP